MVDVEVEAATTTPATHSRLTSNNINHLSLLRSHLFTKLLHFYSLFVLLLLSLHIRI